MSARLSHVGGWATSEFRVVARLASPAVHRGRSRKRSSRSEERREPFGSGEGIAQAFDIVFRLSVVCNVNIHRHAEMAGGRGCALGDHPATVRPSADPQE
jgi:hypothetical protein